MEQEIGYMQLHIHVYRKGELYAEFAINAYDECHIVKTELISSEYKTIVDPADKNKKVVQVIIKVLETNFTIAMLIPVHQSENWEAINQLEEYSVNFYCILGSSGYGATEN